MRVVNKYGLGAVAALAVPAAAMTYRASSEPLSKKEQEWRDVELQKRRKKLIEMIEFVQGHIQELEASSDGEAKLQIRFQDMFPVCTEVLEVDPKNAQVARGLVLALQLLRLELKRTAQKTVDGEQQYRDGDELEKLVKSHATFTTAVQRACFSAEEWSSYKEEYKKFRPVFRSSEMVSWKLRSADILKAVKLVFLARKCLPFVVLNAGLSAAAGMLRALGLFYRTQALEVFRKENWQWAEFRASTRAVIITKALSIVMSNLQRNVNRLGNDELIHTVRTKMYKALLRQDFEWYRLGQKDQRDVHEVFSSIFQIPYSVQGFMSVPTQLIDAFMNISMQLAIIRQRSSGLLKAMIGIYWARFGVQKLLSWSKGKIKDRLFGEIVTPDISFWAEPLFPENLPTVRSFAAERKIISNWEVFWKSDGREEQQFETIDTLFEPLTEAVAEVGGIAGHTWCGQLVQSGNMKVSEMENLIMFSDDISSKVESTAQLAIRAKESFAPLAKAWDLVSLKPKVDLSCGITPEYKRAKGDIVFKDVKFKYPTGAQVLDCVSFVVQSGQICGITGTSGGGKSTIFKLLERFYDPQEGTITLDGVDVKDLNPTWLRKQIAVVSQKPRLFRLPLRDNLGYGCEVEPSTDDIEAACKAAHIHDMIFNNKEKFPSGLYTSVSGDTLSGGELQRIAIARAILMDAPILFLDEATSALDSESQSAVNAALENLMKGRTVLSIAHRLEAIKGAATIICLHEGKVVEQGKHFELIEKGGHYHNLYQKQIEATATPKVGKEAEPNPPIADTPGASVPTGVSAPLRSTQLAELRQLTHALDTAFSSKDRQEMRELILALNAFGDRCERGLRVPPNGPTDYLDVDKSARSVCQQKLQRAAAKIRAMRLLQAGGGAVLGAARGAVLESMTAAY